jgi:hypothetical protein
MYADVRGWGEENHGCTWRSRAATEERKTTKGTKGPAFAGPAAGPHEREGMAYRSENLREKTRLERIVVRIDTDGECLRPASPPGGPGGPGRLPSAADLQEQTGLSPQIDSSWLARLGGALGGYLC